MPFWIIYVLFSIVGVAAYNVSMKIAGDHINPFLFTASLTGVALIGHLLCILFYKLYMGEAVTWQADKTGLSMAALAGVSVVLIDLCIFFAIKNGGVVATNTLFTIGAMILTTLAGYFIFKESFSPVKIAGVVLGVISLIMLAKG